MAKNRVKTQTITRPKAFEPRTQCSLSGRTKTGINLLGSARRYYFGYYPKAPLIKPDLPWKICTTTKNTRMIRRSDRFASDRRVSPSVEGNRARKSITRRSIPGWCPSSRRAAKSSTTRSSGPITNSQQRCVPKTACRPVAENERPIG
jgi:hypothetical protein